MNLTDASTRVYEVNAQGLMNSSLAVPLSSTNSLDQAEQTLRDRRGGRSELDVERHRAAGERAEVRMPTLESLSTIDQYADRAQGRGIDALTLRRVAEMLQAIDPSTTAALRALLAKQRPDNFRPPLYQVAR
ncbi:conserved hypothetical protein [Nocardia seriolae]|nr:conserved hypothetical protein [Nocardia seriolae]